MSHSTSFWILTLSLCLCSSRFVKRGHGWCYIGWGWYRALHLLGGWWTRLLYLVLKLRLRLTLRRLD